MFVENYKLSKFVLKCYYLLSQCFQCSGPNERSQTHSWMHGGTNGNVMSHRKLSHSIHTIPSSDSFKHSVSQSVRVQQVAAVNSVPWGQLHLSSCKNGACSTLHNIPNMIPWIHWVNNSSLCMKCYVAWMLSIQNVASFSSLLFCNFVFHTLANSASVL